MGSIEEGSTRSRSASPGTSEGSLGSIVGSDAGDEIMPDQQLQSGLSCGNGCLPALSDMSQSIASGRSSLMEELEKHPEAVADIFFTPFPAYFGSVPPPPLPMAAPDLASQGLCS